MTNNRINSTSAWVENLELTRPYKIATRWVKDIQNVFVMVTLDDGTVGFGAGSPVHNVTGEDIAACLASVSATSLQWLRGESIISLDDVATLVETLRNKGAGPAALAAVDIALHDALAKTLNQPLGALLGQQHSSLPTSITIGIKNVNDTLREAEEYLERGFSHLKIKCGDDVSTDILRLQALHQTHADNITLRVDCNQGYDANTLENFITATHDIPIELIEQPFAISALNDLKKLPLSLRDRIALDENLLSVDDAKRIAHDRLVGIFNIKLMKCGGITAAREIAAIAQAANITLMWGCNDESRISISAALHCAYSCANTRFLDLDGSLDLARDVVSGGFTIEHGVMSTTQLPGLGCVLRMP